MTFFKDLYGNNEMEFPDATGLGIPQKAALAQRMKSIGCKVNEIAEHFQLSKPRIYQLLKYEVDQDISELENQTFLDTLMLQIKTIEDDIDRYKGDQQRIVGSIDPETGTNRRPNREYLELGRLIKDLQRMIIDLKKVGGILPVVANEVNLHSTLSDLNPENDESRLKEKNSEELTKILYEKLSHTTASVSPKNLKDIKDNKVL